MNENPRLDALRNRIEEVARASWPALEQHWRDGWLLRFANGYSRRSNSVYPLSSPPGDLPSRVRDCEQTFRREGLAPTFRMTGFQGPADLDALLAQRGYERVTPTFVLHRPLIDWERVPLEHVEMHELSIDDWIATFAALNGTPQLRTEAHRAILAATPRPLCLAVAGPGGRSVACGMAVLTSGFCGIFDVLTDPHERNQGFGTAQVQGLLNWARSQGATDAYLQVLQANRPALRLYEKLAFEVCHEYWYRVLPPVPPPTDSRIGRPTPRR